MNSSQLMLAAIANGLEDDATTAAALDAIREESGCTLLAAVMEVARIHRATRDARDLRDATAALAEGSPYRAAVQSAIAQCAFPDFPTSLTAVVVEGDTSPTFFETSEQEDGGWFGPMSCTVGCRWVLARVAEVKEKVRDAMEEGPPRRRVRRPNAGAKGGAQ